MKRYLFCFVMMMCVMMVGWGQSVPQQFNYQAVVWTEDNQIVADRDVTVVISLLQGSATGEMVYTTTHMVHTNQNGLFSVDVGSVMLLTEVDWGNGPYYLNVEVSGEENERLVVGATEQVVSVPYALYAEVADSVKNLDISEKQVLWKRGDTIFLTGGSYVELPAMFDGDYRNLTNTPTNISEFENDAGFLTGEVQVLSISNDTIFLTGGSFVKLPRGYDRDYNHLLNLPTIPTQLSDLQNDVGFITQEVQALSISGDTIFLTGGSWVKIPYVNEVQDLGDVVALGNDAGNRQLKDVKDPTELQDVVTVEHMDSVINDADVNFGAGTFHTYTVTACDEYTWNGNRYASTGVYTHVYSTGGYYSVDTLKLTIRKGTYNFDSVTAAGSYSWHDSVYTESDTLVYNYYNRYGCSSSDTLRLRIIEQNNPCKVYRMEDDTATAVACGWLSWYGAILHESGVYEHSLGNIARNGCDSVVKVTVRIKESFRNDTIARVENSITWRGNTYTEQGDYGDTLLASNGCDSIYALHLMMGSNEGIGALNGLFSVANGVQVRFAQGNLQYQSSTNYWRFAEQQYDVRLVKCASGDYSDWSDLYGWATSGYHDAADTLCKHYFPWSISIVPAEEGSVADRYNQYGYGPSTNNTELNIVGTNKNYDWGEYNPIINGGNSAELWRTMSEAEWDYVLNRRHNARYLRSLGHIRNVVSPSGSMVNVYGYFIMPDNWTRPTAVSFRPNAASANENSYSLWEWNLLEASGAVFFPAGYNADDLYNGYWSSTSGGNGGANAFIISFEETVLASYNRSNSHSVRLVQEYRAGVNDCNCSYLDTTIVASGDFSWHGYSYNESGDYMEAIVNAAGCDSIISLNLIMEDQGVLSGNFSVSATKKVHFSKGNLQYKATADIWRFAEEQYGFVGEANKFRSKDYNGWIDLFGWGTSGYNDSCDLWNLYAPWNSNMAGYGYGPSPQMRDRNLVNTSANYDWGVYNAVANGGNRSGQWRTLTVEEWRYLIYERPSAGNLCGFGKVHDVSGFFILPDNWVAPAGVYFNPATNENVYNDVQWRQMEVAGAVFLPISGISNSSPHVDHLGVMGKYWSSTSEKYVVRKGLISSAYLLSLNFNEPSYGILAESKALGISVRLVKDM